ncbi:hypothetical protein A5N15_03075 [Rothia kristinae]|uniref:Uncharacterized protein n=1 Tax=Rothia kristinae TaxID=37923 RepID=A0A657IVH5_9MICC|nr:hypothetical protein A5N15_03075 [Rothia kristinae]
MGALGDLRQLLGIPEQQEVPCGPGDREHVGHGVLTGLVDDQQIQLAGGEPLRIGEVPGGAPVHPPGHRDLIVLPGQEVRDLLGADPPPRHRRLRDLLGAAGTTGLGFGHGLPRHPACCAHPRSRFSITAWDCATTPIRHPRCTSRPITCAPTKDFPVPGGPCTAT